MEDCKCAGQAKSSPTNPNNCGACEHKQHPDDGWCYMFRDEPTAVCMQHSLRKVSLRNLKRMTYGNQSA